MKKLIAILLASCMAFSISACGGEEPQATSESSQSTEASQVSEEASESPEATGENGETGFPQEETITFMVPGKSGGGSDLAIRFMAEALQKNLGLTVVVNNYESNTVGHQMLAASKNDGSNIMLATAALNVQYITGVADLDPINDLELVACLQDNGFATLAVPVDAPYNNFTEFVEYAKANPGKINAGQPNSGNNQFQFGMLENELGIDLNAVECSSESERLTNLAGGFIDVGFVGLKNALEYSEAGKLKVIGTLADDGRVIADMDDSLPENFKTLQEQGFEDCFWSVHHYVYAPKGMDEAQVEAMNATFKQIIEDEAVLQGLISLGHIPEWYNVEDSYKMRDNEFNRLVGIAKSLGIHING